MWTFAVSNSWLLRAISQHHFSNSLASRMANHVGLVKSAVASRLELTTIQATATATMRVCCDVQDEAGKLGRAHGPACATD